MVMTAMYSGIPYTIENPIDWRRRWRKKQRAIALANLRGEKGKSLDEIRKEYAPLPWPMEDMIGTTWVNLWTGHQSVIASIEVPSPKYQPQEGLAMVVDSPMNGDSWKDTIGFPAGDCYIIENWTCHDHLTLQAQLEWLLIALFKIGDHINQYEGELARMDPARTSCYTSNKNYVERMLKREQQNRVEGLDKVHEFAEKHGLDVPMYLINTGQQGQLSLF